MWTKTTLRLSETNTPSQSSLSIFLTRIVYFGEESSFNREPRIPGPAGRQICSLYGIRGYKKRVVDGEPQVTRPTLNILWRGSSCRLACCEGKRQYSVSAADLPGRPGWLNPDWVVYGMRTKTKKNSAEIRVLTRGR